jgi:hypothetical protein
MSTDVKTVHILIIQTSYFEYDANIFAKGVCIDEGELEGNSVGVEERTRLEKGSGIKREYKSRRGGELAKGRAAVLIVSH